jgi:hypothetical protein
MAATLGSFARASAQNVSYAETVSAGVPMKIICVNLNDPNVKITGILTKYGAGHAEPFGTLIGRTKPTVAITGTFFGISSKIPVGDIVIDGRLAHFGGLGTAICVTDNNEVEFIRPKMYRHTDWSKYDFVLCCGPRLVTDGIPYVEPWTEGFHDKHMLNRNGRLAVGITKNHELMFVATRKPVYLSKLAKAMRGLGVVDAINLDAGSSMGLHYKGKTLIHPSRQLTNLILVYDNKDHYYDFKDRLLPLAMRSASAKKSASKAVASTGSSAQPTTQSAPVSTLLPSSSASAGYPETGNK